MPIQSCSSEGKSGHRFGKSGKCYTGKNSKSKARKQGVAIKISQAKNKGKKKK
jgi:hypothetical protein